MPNLATDVAIIGAGMSGLVCGQALQHVGLRVTIFEKSRGVGGRMATRRTDSEISCDHGAQYFTVSDSAFESTLEKWQQQGVVARWRAPIVEIKNGEILEDKSETNRFVGMPRMNSVCHSLADELEIHTQTRILAPRRDEDAWELYDENEQLVSRSKTVLCTTPAPQAVELLSAVPSLVQQIHDVEMKPCWALVMVLEVGLDLSYGGAFINGSELSWIACNSSKPGREASPEVWVLHASAEWSQHHLQDSPESIERALLRAFQRETGRCPSAIRKSWTHRWRYAQPSNPLPSRYLFDEHSRIGVCGDWCGGPRVEGAFQSGLALANRVIEFSAH
ncbi:NAD(P)/FAD-dependent oxidoreductase [Thalassoroseus pseudoceratinae]|uniref:NAD(P)/FAD-dependent oxidoreductase n=1 Tax=Thalassoroseus pseudoceratinae TaxID=2713176 RepID=UPI001422C81D|nr:FAD-dependent oxidoreductase [Thalassoroseus pseudoceratinae]